MTTLEKLADLQFKARDNPIFWKPIYNTALSYADFAALSAEMDRMKAEILNLVIEREMLKQALKRLEKAARDGDDCQGAIMNEMEALGENA